MNRLLSFWLCLGMVFCATISTAEQSTEHYRANFAYTAPATEPSAKREATFTVADIVYKQGAGGGLWFASPQFAELSPAVRRDLSSLLLVKGFRVLGQYDSYDLIPFQDKKAIDMLLLPTFELSVAIKNIKEQIENFWAWKSPTLQTGTVEVSGKFTVELREISTRELLWIKTIPLKKSEFPLLVRIPWGKHYSPGKPYAFDPILDGLAGDIERQYPGIMAAIFNLIDAEEMATLRNEAQELKHKKGF